MTDREADMIIQAKTGLPSANIKRPDFSTLLMNVGRSKDRAAFAELFNHFAPRVKSYMLRLGSDETMAEELAQQTLLQVWRKSGLFDADKAAASTWIFRIARNLRIDALRKHKHFFDDEFDLTTIEDEQETAETLINQEQRAKQVHLALSGLSDKQAKVIHLSFYDGLSHGEIAAELDLPLGTVKSRIRLAFSKLRKTLKIQNREMV